MPVYEYKCSNCGHEFEAEHSMRDPAPTCPSCGVWGKTLEDGSVKCTLKRLIGRTNFVLKGSGWAKDNYKG